ncbi:hypothetical protein [Nocardioides terrisoli]|uniref:hypothetical protein n=1 Tax=Nocardioides terrisoli TaxID=3388267 RepID=UPI00287BA5A5|nr:hypothetical protein [Nocardioides marmorisolisilvae]
MTTDDGAQSRGEAIRRRMRRIGLTNSGLSKESGVDRKTITRALDDVPQTQTATFERLEWTLDRLENELGHGGPDAIMSTEVGLIEFEVTGDFGVRVVVKGPIENAAELEESVARLIRDIRTGTEQ